MTSAPFATITFFYSDTLQTYFPYFLNEVLSYIVTAAIKNYVVNSDY